eukprot:TRINITY_DN15507_c0_g1_i1.p1 TRINITY_DN15507_c0_g1~~TRINITY_DN15507_c0_g1_i1.p1  ORF type:complete len:725 (-),score=110.06 TRINITY_DN15507_c0_g1_i1:207-2381(-)
MFDFDHGVTIPSAVGAHFSDNGHALSNALNGSASATSLKAQLVTSVPTINDVASYHTARRLLKELGGVSALLEELVFANLVDPDTGLLRLVDRPFNVFAHIGAGNIVQQSMSAEQSALGSYAEKYVICANKPEHDLHWDTKDKTLIKRASMGKRHRFLTTKNLHWQWFNAITFGLVSPELGGATLQQAVVHVEEMKAAALHYARHAGDWSDDIGLFINVFGHNNVNSLFIHVLDMSELGPSFGFQKFKCCSLDDVLAVLRDEAVQKLLPSAPVANSDLIRFKKLTRMPGINIAGTDGATSLKDELVARVPALRDAAGYREARRLLVHEFGGPSALKSELVRAGFIDDDNGHLTTETAPFNVFARIAAEKLKQPEVATEQQYLEEFKETFVICCNLPAADAHYDSSDPQWIGKASMSKHHRFLTTKNLHWQWFNALAFGLLPKEEGGVPLEECVAHVELMKSAALKYAANAGWSKKIGLFFHVFGHNSVNSLHLHIVDMEVLGPTFWHFEYKNCPLDCVLKVLREEMDHGHGDMKAKDIVEAINTMVKVKSSSSPSTDLDEALRRMQATGVIELNVGGVHMVTPVDTLLASPHSSWLYTKFVHFRGSWPERLPQDSQGRIVLDVPPRSFAILLNQLRLLRLTPSNDVLQPPEVPLECKQEVETLAHLLGLGMLLEQPQWGRGQGMAGISQAHRPCALVAGAWWCARRRQRMPASAAPCAEVFDDV